MAKHVWLGTIGLPHNLPDYWIVGETKESAMKAALQEARRNWGVPETEVDWAKSGDSYYWTEDIKPVVEVRKIGKVGCSHLTDSECDSDAE